MDDASLVKRYQLGDIRAFNELANRWQSKIHRFSYGFFGNTDDASEITQKTLIRVYNKVRELEEPGKFSSWIYRIANNLCLDELKRAGRRKSSPLGSWSEQIPESENHVPSRQLETKELGVIIQNALLSLPDDQRVVIILKEFEGMKFREIAEILDESENTIKSRMYYGLKTLRKILTKQNIQPEYLNYD
jgi:RNA polymerase sigma-70 factor (ECF subfamily)